MAEEEFNPYEEFPQFVVEPVFWLADQFPASWAANCNHFKDSYPFLVTMVVWAIGLVVLYRYFIYFCFRQLMKVWGANNSVVRVFDQQLFGKKQFGKTQSKPAGSKSPSKQPTGSKEKEGNPSPRKTGV